MPGIARYGIEPVTIPITNYLTVDKKGILKRAK
jgi:hypothetical protein